MVVLAAIGAEVQNPGQLRFTLIGAILVGAALFSLCFRLGAQALTALCEGALYRVRLRLAEKIRQAKLTDLEQIGAANLYEQIVQNTTIISHACWPMTAGLLSALMLVMMLVYIGALSLFSLALLLVLMSIIVPYYLRRNKHTKARLHQVAQTQTDLFNSLTDLLQGLAQVQLHGQRGDDLLDDFGDLAKSMRQVTVEASAAHQADYVFVNLGLLALLATSVFLLPLYVQLPPWILTDLAVAMVFLISPVSSVISTLPDVERASAAAENILALEQRLDAAHSVPAQVHGDPFPGGFQELRVTDLCFHHLDPAGRRGFGLGPLSFSISAGEIIFIVGGNGSGKTTLLKLLTTLYTPSSGLVLLNGIPVGPQNVAAYREMIAAIFGDFHLFRKLYGLPATAAAELFPLLQSMQLGQSTALVNGRFTNLELSTGQRKRLAMSIALLEDRPLYIFDEWAADQDPEFRRYYYEELLPDLKRRGKTVLAISHDDRYFHCADRVITLDYGTIRNPSPKA
jgi:putative ATP-binding cassette transporter